MAFLTKIALVSLLATSSFALPSPTSDDGVLMARALCSRNIDANFDDLKATVPLPGLPVPSPLPTNVPADSNLNIVPTPYKELDWNGGFRYIPGAAISRSPPTVAIFNGQTQALNEARISIYGTVQSFKLRSVYFACFLQSQGTIVRPVSCTITATGTKTNGQVVTENFNYTPSGLKQFVLPSSFIGLKSVVFKRDVLETALTTVVLDDVEYAVSKPC